MKIKIGIIMISLLLSILTLASCSGLFGGEQGGDQGGQQNGDNNTDVPNDASERMDISGIVYADTSIDIFNVRTKLYSMIGIIPTYLDNEPIRDGEVAIGDTNRDITAKAKAALAELIDASYEYDCGYIIYAEGNNVAVYWQVPEMSTVALAKFESICLDEKNLVLDDGVVTSELYVRNEYEEEKYWIALSAVAPADVVVALKKLNAYYNAESIIDFYANLYDPENGGFYYAISARDNPGYLPDMESTQQIIAGLLNNGAYDDINAAYPLEVKQKILEFAKSTQSHVDGYFYHPQWPQGRENLQTDRYGRDMSRATNLISYFMIDTDGDGIEDKQYPNWCAPNGVKCALHTGTNEKCSFAASVSYYTDAFGQPITTTLTSEVSSAVAKVISSVVSPTASVSSHPDYSSREAFSAWLEAYNATVKENSGKAHNLSAIREEITQHGYEDIVLDHLDRVQAEVFAEQLEAGETPTGLWQRNVDYKAVWGLLKYSGWYNAKGSLGRAIDEKYVPYIIDTVIKVILSEPDGEYASNDLYNQWDSINRLIENADRYYGDGLVEIIREKLRQNTAALVDISLEKIRPFRNSNGSFALNSDGTSPKLMYGAPISLGIVEGNVNSTNIFCSMYNAIFECLGYPGVPLFNEALGERFIETIAESEPIEKNEISRDPIGFEDDTLPITLSDKINNSSFSMEITEDPSDPTNQALCITAPTGTNGDTLYFEAVGVGTSCYVFESEIYIDSNTKTSKASENIIQLKIGDKKNTSYLIVIKKNNNKIEINEETSTGTDSRTVNLATLELDQWFKLRIEHYPSGDEYNALEIPMTKIWINDDYVMTSSSFFGAQVSDAVPNNIYTHATFYFLKSPDIKLYIDNCYFALEDKVFEEGDV